MVTVILAVEFAGTFRNFLVHGSVLEKNFGLLRHSKSLHTICSLLTSASAYIEALRVWLTLIVVFLVTNRLSLHWSSIEEMG